MIDSKQMQLLQEKYKLTPTNMRILNQTYPNASLEELERIIVNIFVLNKKKTRSLQTLDYTQFLSSSYINNTNKSSVDTLKINSLKKYKTQLYPVIPRPNYDIMALKNRITNDFIFIYVLIVILFFILAIRSDSAYFFLLTFVLILAFFPASLYVNHSNDFRGGSGDGNIFRDVIKNKEINSNSDSNEQSMSEIISKLAVKSPGISLNESIFEVLIFGIVSISVVYFILLTSIVFLTNNEIFNAFINYSWIILILLILAYYFIELPILKKKSSDFFYKIVLIKNDDAKQFLHFFIHTNNFSYYKAKKKSIVLYKGEIMKRYKEIRISPYGYNGFTIKVRKDKYPKKWVQFVEKKNEIEMIGHPSNLKTLKLL